MEGRIGSLHVRYGTAIGASIASARAPGLDRAIASGFGEAVERRLSERFGDDPSVLVLREVTTRVRIRRLDASLDARWIDELSRASAEAVASVVRSSPGEDALVRFEDQAAFVASFLVDLLDGHAWERWYYGAFARHRRADAGATIVAVLGDNQAWVTRVLGRLARLGRLSAVLEKIGASKAREWIEGAPEARRPEGRHGVEPLAAATFAILRALGLAVAESAPEATLSRYLATSPLPPSWTDRRSLTAWVLAFARFTVEERARRSTAIRPASGFDAVRALLASSLDWLDRDWLLGRLDSLAAESADSPGERDNAARELLSAPDRRRLRLLSELVRDGAVRIDAAEGKDAAIVRLLAALAARDSSLSIAGPALRAAVERVVEAWREAAGTDGGARRLLGRLGGAAGSAVHAAAAPILDRRVEAVREAGPAAVELLRGIAKSATEGVDEGWDGEPTPHAGLHLLARTLLDVRLEALAREAEVPFAPLLEALAGEWLDAVPPFDGPTALFLGAPDPASASRLLDLGVALSALVTALEEMLLSRRVIEAPVAVSGGVSAQVTSIATLVLAAFSHWVPGVRGGTKPWVVENCLRRAGRVRVGEERIEVRLDPAPFDVVLERAGYFGPVAAVPWMGGRSISFTVLHAPGG